MNEFRSVGTVFSSTQARPCGLCGDVRQMSRSHVPPQMAGNNTSVLRAADVVSADRVRHPGRWSQGGLWVRGLCTDCNHMSGRLYDAAYADFANQVRKLTNPFARSLRPYLNDPPPATLAPGLVARCVLVGMFAVHPRLRLIFPDLAADVHMSPTLGASVRWPGNLSLLLGTTPTPLSDRALLSSGVWYMRVLKQRVAHSAFADIYFPPFSWSLLPTDLLHDSRQHPTEVTVGLTDASDWVRYGPHCTSVDLRFLTNRLSDFVHPAFVRDGSWIELMGSDSGPDRDAVFVHGMLP